MASNGTPQGYLNNVINRNNNTQIRDRTMEQDGTNSGNPYGYIPQLPNQQVPGSYPTNRYIPPTMTGVDGAWNQTGMTYSLPTAYNPYGQGGTPYGTQQLQPYMPRFYNGNGAGGGAAGAPAPQQPGMPVGPQGPQPMQAAGNKGVGVIPNTFQQAPTQVPAQMPPAANSNQIPKRQFGDGNRPQYADYFNGHVPHFSIPYNPSQSQAVNNLNTAMGAMQQTTPSSSTAKVPSQLTQFTQSPMQVPPNAAAPNPQPTPVFNGNPYGQGGGDGLGPQSYNPYQIPLFNSPDFSRPIGNVIS